MNAQDPLEETLARLRQTVPPDDVRTANRQAVQTALKQPEVTHWWQRTVAVPLPAALLTAATLVISISIHLVSPQGHDVPLKPDVVEDPAGGSGDSVMALAASTEPLVEYSETQRYFCGIGVVDRNMFYKVKE